MSAGKVCVITGGSSGIGVAAARRMGEKGYSLVLAARTPAKLEKALKELEERGVEASAFQCDMGNWQSVQDLAAYAAQLGEVETVLHIAGMSPHMGTPEQILQGNALGTVHIHDAFYPVLEPGGCLVDTSSMSAYLAPRILMPRKAFRLAERDRQAFLRQMENRVNLLPARTRTGAAYAISKYFVLQYVKAEAARFGRRQLRVLSITPGSFDTPMGQMEQGEASQYLQYNAIPRTGEPEEIAALFAAVSDPEMGYLTGCDILCDGGCVAGKTTRSYH